VLVTTDGAISDNYYYYYLFKKTKLQSKQLRWVANSE
jgi:hypothetical protein